MIRALSVLILVGLSVIPAIAQRSVSSNSGPDGEFRGSATFGAPPSYPAKGVENAAYCAEEMSESVQTLADGTRITRPAMSTKVCRDSQGRTRRERSLMHGPAGQQIQAPLIVEIDDPVGRFRLTVDSLNKVAHKQELATWQPRQVPGAVGLQTSASIPPPGPARTATPQPAPAPTSVAAGVVGAVPPRAPNTMPRPEMASEELGTQVIEGIVAKGTRRTMTWPVGSQGNDRPMTNVTETWVSDELKTLVLMKTTDPRSGEHTMKLINISRAEPDPTLFQVPPDYQLVEEKGEFTIKWGQQ